MVIDTHIRPALFSPICENKERFEKRCDQMNYHLMKPSSIELLKKQYALAGIEKVFLLPSDCSFETGEPDISNDEIEKIVQCDPTFFVGFASADPRKESAAEELEKAFKFQNLAGLYINTARLHMYPCDERLFVLYDICKKYKRPIIFQAGLSMENNSLAKYCRPIEFEEVLSKYPEVNICLSHVGWPWVQETAALLLKYENCYTNTALMNFDGPYQIYKKVFTEDMGALWVEHNIADEKDGKPVVDTNFNKEVILTKKDAQTSDIWEKVLTGAEYTAYHVGTDGKKYYYTYHVSEMKVDGYTTEITYKGDRQYSITVTNTKNWFDSLLPETGGMGKALLYTLGVLLLCLVTATEYRKRKSTRSQSSYK